MKRIFTAFIALALALVLFTVPAFAAESDDIVTDTETVTEETVTDTTVEPEISAPSEEEKFYDELLDYVTNGANWAKIGGVVLAIIAAVVVFPVAGAPVMMIILLRFIYILLYKFKFI